jgi:hypothetical protein
VRRILLAAGIQLWCWSPRCRGVAPAPAASWTKQQIAKERRGRESERERERESVRERETRKRQSGKEREEDEQSQREGGEREIESERDREIERETERGGGGSILLSVRQYVSRQQSDLASSAASWHSCAWAAGASPGPPPRRRTLASSEVA